MNHSDKEMLKFAKQLDVKITKTDLYIWFPLHRAFVAPLRNFYYNLKHLPKNLTKWARFVWNDRDWDCEHTYEAFEIKCRAQARLLTKHGNAENSQEMASQALECAEALKRLRLHEYIDYEQINNTDLALEKETELRNKDIEIVKKHISNIMNWWD